MNKVRVGVMAAEILQRRTVAHGTGRKPQPPFQDLGGIGAGDRVHRVERHRQTGGTNGREVEQRFHQRRVIRNRIDDLDDHVADRDLTQHVEIQIRGIDRQPAVDRRRPRIERIGDLLGRGAAVGNVVLDPEILARAAGIVAGGQHQPAQCLADTDQMAGSWRGQQPATSDDDTGETVGRGDADRLLNDLPVQKPAIAADHQCRTGLAIDDVKDRLDEVLGIVRLLEHRHLLAKAGRARLLIGVRLGLDNAGHAAPVRLL